MALEKIKLDGSENGATAADKINIAFDAVDVVPVSPLKDNEGDNYLWFVEIASPEYPLILGTTELTIGNKSVPMVLDVAAVISDPLRFKNDTALQAYNADYTGIVNLISRTAMDTNTNGDYDNEVVVGDSDVKTVIRSTTGYIPAIRRGTHGNTVDEPIATVVSGFTGWRPSVDLSIGQSYFDTDLGFPVWYNGIDWVDATGTKA